METGKQETGKLGEDLACEYLVGKGYKVLRRNWRTKGGELDIIARAKNKTLVFIEVKAMAWRGGPLANLVPEDQITAAKLRKFRRACEMFVAKNSDLVGENCGWRMDLVATELAGQKAEAIRHYENI